jgi:hypothetical protein
MIPMKVAQLKKQKSALIYTGKMIPVYYIQFYVPESTSWKNLAPFYIYYIPHIKHSDPLCFIISKTLPSSSISSTLWGQLWFILFTGFSVIWC